MTNEELLERIANGDEAALTKLCLMNTGLVKDRARLIARNRQIRDSRRATASAVAQAKSGHPFTLHSAGAWAGMSFSAQASLAVCANFGARSRTHSK